MGLGLLSKIISLVGSPLVDVILGNITGIFKAYFDKEITEAQLKAQLQEALIKGFVEVEKTQADALTKTYSSFMDAMKTNTLMQICWGSVVLSQLFVLLYHQLAIPFIIFMGWATKYPPSGSTVDWAYLLVAGCLGLGPVVLNGGPGKFDISKYKNLIK